MRRIKSEDFFFHHGMLLHEFSVTSGFIVVVVGVGGGGGGGGRERRGRGIS